MQCDEVGCKVLIAARIQAQVRGLVILKTMNYESAGLLRLAGRDQDLHPRALESG